MRKYIKDNISQLLETIGEGLMYIADESNGGREVVFNDCVDATCSVGEVIEAQVLEQGKQEAYQKLFDNIICELEKIKDGLVNEWDIKLAVNSGLEAVQNMKQAIDMEEEKLEIVFMPYKVSMWDCMESVWETAQQDPTCECYVVPIPYYEKKDGKVYREVYEGTEFPEQVPITHYSEYNFQERVPDVIFVHNPYDGCNTITSVHPNYYSDELKKVTTNLVYIPYFVAGTYMNWISATRSMTVPVLKNIDWVVAQSQVHKEMLMNVGVDESKIILAGNPKLDATIKTVSKNYLVPDAWQQKLSGKKVILYNSSITHLLVNNKSLAKLSDDLDKILSHPKCGVIWRPHPLLEATIIAMREELQEQYMLIKNKIIQSANAVFDVSPNIYPAIQISDALMSDYSSIMFQYVVTGKPILSMDTEYGYFVNDEKPILATNYSSYYFRKPWTLNEHIAFDEKVMADRNGTSIEQFLDMIVKEKDPKKEQRMEELRNSLINTNGKCGEEVYKTLKNRIANN